MWRGPRGVGSGKGGGGRGRVRAYGRLVLHTACRRLLGRARGVNVVLSGCCCMYIAGGCGAAGVR